MEGLASGRSVRTILRDQIKAKPTTSLYLRWIKVKFDTVCISIKGKR